MQHLGKNPRILWIYTTLLQGYRLNKKELALQYEVTEKSIQRDMEDLRAFFHQNTPKKELLYDSKAKEYYLQDQRLNMKMPAKEVIPILKTVFESSAILPYRLFPVLERMAELISDEQDREMVQHFLHQEQECYQAPDYQTQIGEMLCRAERAVWEKRWVRLRYRREENTSELEAIVLPQAVVLRENRFFLVAQTTEGVRHNAMGMYQVDLIVDIEPQYPSQLHQRQNQKQVRQKIISTKAGEEYRVQFVYHGPSLSSIIKKFPSAKGVPVEDGWQVEIMVYGKAIGTWLRGQGKQISDIKIERSNHTV